MKPRTVLISAAVAVALTGAVCAGTKLATSEDNWEFGDAPNVGTISHTFKLTNAGGTGLRILSVSASCGCTSTKVENQELKPGESTGITATFNSAAYPSGGRFVKQITVMTDDSTEPAKVLTIGATVCTTAYAWGTVTPKAIELQGETGKGKASWTDVEIRNQTALRQKVAVLEKVGLVKEVRVSQKTLSPGGQATIRVKAGSLRDPFPPSSLTIQLISQEGERRVSIPVTFNPDTKEHEGSGPLKN